MLPHNRNGFFPYTPGTNLLYGLDVGIDMLNEEGLENVFARHERLAEAVRRAVQAWGLEIFCRVPEHHSSVLTAVLMPEGHDADAFRAAVLDNFDMSLGAGLNKIKGKAEFVNFSFDVKIEGKSATRALDLMLHNDKNTPPFPLIQPPAIGIIIEAKPVCMICDKTF